MLIKILELSFDFNLSLWFYPDHAIISHVVVIGDSFDIYLSTIKKNVWPGIYEWNNKNFSLNMKLKVKT